VALGLLITACQVTPTPSSSVVPSKPSFAAASYPVGAPADCSYGGEIAQIKALDELTVAFTLCYPDPAFLSKIALPNTAIQDSDWLTRYGGPGQGVRTKANGTGPYRVPDALSATGDHITLSRFDGYWGQKAIASQVIFKWNASPAARLQALGTGTVDGIDNPSPNDLASILGDSSLQLQRRAALSTIYIGMTDTYAPFDSTRIRHALAIGIDRQRIIDNALPPGSSLASYFTPCGIEFGCGGDPWYDHDLAAAKAILATPGFSGPLTTHIYYRNESDCGQPDLGPVARELQGQLQDGLGITADIQLQDSTTFLAKLSAGLLDGLWLTESCAGYPDVSGFLDHAFNNLDNGQFGSIDASITGPLVAGDQTADPTTRQAAYLAANNAIRDVAPMIPIAHVDSATAWKADVVGAVASPLDAESFATIDPGGRSQLVWMQNGSPRSYYCVDQTDPDSVRLCQSVFEQLYAFKPGTAEVTPSLATSCDPNQQLTVWTCHLRSGVTFHDGAQLDAGDVLLSYATQWDAKHPLHIGRAADLVGWAAEFGPLLNAPPAAP